MDLSPYLKLMLEKNADALILSADSAPILRLLNQEKPVGKTLLTTDFINQFVNELLNETQKQELDNFKSVHQNYSSSGSNFKVQVDKEINNTVIQIFPERSATPLASQHNIQVLGALPDNTIDIMPYLVEMVKREGSDIFMTAGSSVKIKISGVLAEMDKYVLTPELTQSIAFSIMNKEQITEFIKTKDLDFAISLPDGSAR
ncbi:MAG: twitching motility protein, partial [Methylococcales bacterium]|nr:twitching motility protein [Methylococcales bacterium]